MSGSISPENRELLERLFERAADLTPAEQERLMEEECAGNEALREKLAWLLAGHAGEDRLSHGLSVAPERVGTKIGPYRLLEKVGEGGMGVVYAAEQHKPIRRRVALKLIKPGMDSAQVVRRFEAERQALACMAHPNIAQVLDAGATREGLPFFVMEFVAGDPVTEYCNRYKLTTRERLELFVTICDGVQHAHQKGIIHRDLKPSNILVMRHDGAAVPKVIDFGVARTMTGQRTQRSFMTMAGQLIGTLDYMSPEQADPTGLDIDTRSDIYSLGVVLYQLLSGMLPFEHNSVTGVPFSEIQRVISEVEPPTPSTRLRKEIKSATSIAPLHGTDRRTLLRQLTGDLDWICLKALEKDPARRYASASELAQDVRRHLASRPVLAGRPGVLYRARKFVRRNRVGVAAGALVLVAALAGVLGIVSGRLEAEARADDLLSLSALQTLDDLVAEAGELWPVSPDRLGEYKDWIRRGAELVRELPRHEQKLAELRSRAHLGFRVATPEAGAAALDGEVVRTPEWTFDESGDRWWHHQLAKLVERLKAFSDPATGLLSAGISPEYGWGVPRRRDYASTVVQRTLTAPEVAASWQTVAARVAANSRYVALTLSPQLGLVPLGPDPVSTLEEFAHVQTGSVPVRDPSGKLMASEQTALVFVLLPGGTFAMGGQSDPARPNYDSSATDYEGPVHEVTLSPFFLSKFEMTQGQWLRAAGRNPSRIQPGPYELYESMEGLPVNLSHPVEQVSWITCNDLCTRLQLTLPSEAQWEYGARAGTSSVWWTGDAPESLIGAANLLDQWLLDGHGMHARVGSFAGNTFGLHDVVGNVWEWCLDGYDPEFFSRRPEKNPVCELPPSVNHVLRGGGYGAWAARARIAGRRIVSTTLAGGGQGLRPARKVR